jgi:hypothetical protein
MSNIATRQETIQPVANDAGAIIQVIERAAVNPQVDIDKMERLIQMQERIMDRNAKSAYAAALSAMQPELPVISERGAIDLGRGPKQRYALWEDINDAIKPVLAKHGFALSFRTGQLEGKISVTGILSHREGHSEETTMYLPADTSGSKNAVQAVGSSTSYGKRYTTSALLNLTSRGEDDDGKAGGAKTITADQAADVHALIDEVKADKPKFLDWLGVESVEQIPATKLSQAVKALNDKRRAK